MSSNNKNNSHLPMLPDNSGRNHRSDRLIGISKVLEMYDVSKSTLYQRIREGVFPAPIKDGGRSLWWQSEVEEAIRKIGRRSDKAQNGAA